MLLLVHPKAKTQMAQTDPAKRFWDTQLAFHLIFLYPVAMTYLIQLNNKKEAAVAACYGYSETVEIPAFLGGYPVTALCPYAFSGMRTLEQVCSDFLPDTPLYAVSDDAAGTFLAASSSAAHAEGSYSISSVPACNAAGTNLHLVTALQGNAFQAEDFMDVQTPRICGNLCIISLPSSLLHIGRYAFYGCDKLHTIKMSSTTLDLGTGLFMGCDSVSQIDMLVDEENRSCLFEVLAAFRKPLELTYRIPTSGSSTANGIGSSGKLTASAKTRPDSTAHFSASNDSLFNHAANLPESSRFFPISNAAPAFQVKYRLVFPEYYENADENTPARITTRDLHGSGLFYRNCFANTQFQILRYDSLFPHAEANEPAQVTALLAFLRLAFPEGLLPEARARYSAYLAAHVPALAALFQARFRDGRLSAKEAETAFSAPPLSEAAFFSALLDETAHFSLPALSGMLMELKRKKTNDGAPKPRRRHFEL